MNFNNIWGLISSNTGISNADLLESEFRDSIYLPASNSTLSAFNPKTKEPYILTNQNIIGGFPNFNGASKDAPLLPSSYTVPNVGTKMNSLGLPTTSSPVAGFPNLIWNASQSKWAIPSQGLAWMMSYNMAKSNSISPGNYDPIATHYADDILEPMADYLINSMPGVDGWYNGTNGGSLSLPADWAGYYDPDLETWLPKMFLPADMPATDSFDWTGYDTNNGYFHDYYFIIWAMKTNYPYAPKRLPSTHYDNCPNPSPCTTIQQCFDIFWNLVSQIWGKIKVRLKNRCPNAELMCYNIPVEQRHYYEIIDYNNYPNSEALRQATLDKYINMHDSTAVRDAFSHFGAFAASWYTNHATANPGDPGTASPNNDSLWPYVETDRSYDWRARLMSWFNTDGPGEGKPSWVYLWDTAGSTFIDENTCDILYDRIIDAKFTGAINWSFISSGSITLNQNGQQNLSNLLHRLYSYYNFPEFQPSISSSQSGLSTTITVNTDEWPHTSVEAFEIWRKGPSDLTFSLLTTTASNSYTDTVETEGDYSYYVIAVEEYENDSDESNILEVTATEAVIPPPGPEPLPSFSDVGPYPVLSNSTAVFTKDNIVCVYRLGDSDSLDCATRYKDLHGLDDDQVFAIPCSNVEILDNYALFVDEVENPILSRLTVGDLTNRYVYAIILMPYVPGGFRDGDDIISSTSRLSRIYSSYSKNIFNPLYNRQIFSRLDGSVASSALVCSRIDGSSIVTNTWFDNIENAKSRLNVDGTFYFDSYSAYTYSGASQYTTNLVDFSNNYMSRMGLDIVKTSQPPSGRDAFIPRLTEDSFYWGWGADRGSLSYFDNTSSIRAFFYNADLDGGLSLRNLDSRAWPILAVRSGYIATAGCLSGTSTNPFLRPQPFMDALFRGATLGEAFLYSQPLLDSSMACFGDPLSVFAFPLPSESVELIDPTISWKAMETCLAESVAYIYRKTNILRNMRDYLVSGNVERVQLDLDYKFNDLYVKFDETSWKNDFVILTGKLLNFVVDRNSTSLPFFYPNINQYLTYSGNKITDIVLDTLQNQSLVDSVESSNIEMNGSWIFEDLLEHSSGDFRFYHIELEVVKDFQDFEENDIIFSKDTFSSIVNWYYEDYNGDFKPFESNGITSNYVNRKFRYVSGDSETLIRGEFYWYRVRQKDELEVFEWRYFRRIIFR